MSVGTPTHQGPAIACPHWAPLCLTKARRSFIECCPSRSSSTAARGERAGGVGAPRSAQARRAGLHSRHELALPLAPSRRPQTSASPQVLGVGTVAAVVAAETEGAVVFPLPGRNSGVGLYSPPPPT